MFETPLRNWLIADRYQILGKLEERTYSATYQAVDQETQTLVLLKNTRDTSLAAQQRFAEEYACTIEHPNLARRLDYYWLGQTHLQEGNGGWLVFDSLGGETLTAWLSRRNHVVDPIVAAQLMIQVCNGLEHLHQSNPSLIHKHVGPESIGVWDEEPGAHHAFLRDYGMAQEVQPLMHFRSAILEQSGRGAPEQFLELDTADARTDVYGVGATLYELLTGIQPLQGQDRWLRRVQLERADVVNPAVSSELAEIVERAMALDPNNRYATIGELREALVEAIRFRSKGDDPLFWLLLLLAIGMVFGGIVWFTNRDAGQQAPAIAAENPGTGGELGAAPPPALPATPVPPTPTPDAFATLSAAEMVFVPIGETTTGVLTYTGPGPAHAAAAEALADFAIEATFANSDPPWDYGFAFRHDPTSHFRLSVGSDATWSLIYRQEDPADPGYSSDALVAEGALTNLRLGPGETNHLKLTAAGLHGVFYVNDQPIVQLPLWDKTGAGGLFVASGLRGRAVTPLIHYSNLTVRAAP